MQYLMGFIGVSVAIIAHIVSSVFFLGRQAERISNFKVNLDDKVNEIQRRMEIVFVEISRHQEQLERIARMETKLEYITKKLDRCEKC